MLLAFALDEVAVDGVDGARFSLKVHSINPEGIW
jgi:hypothetical protein